MIGGSPEAVHRLAAEAARTAARKLVVGIREVAAAEGIVPGSPAAARLAALQQQIK